MKIKAIDNNIYYWKNYERTISFGTEFILVKRFIGTCYGEPAYAPPVWLNVNHILTYWDEDNEG